MSMLAIQNVRKVVLFTKLLSILMHVDTVPQYFDDMGGGGGGGLVSPAINFLQKHKGSFNP